MNLSSVFFNMQRVYEGLVIWVLDHWRGLFTLILCALFALVGNFGYQAYRVSQNEEAHKAFVGITRLVGAQPSGEAKKNAEKRSAAEQQRNEALIAAADLFLGNHSSSCYAPAVHGFMARAYLAMGNAAESRSHFLAAKKAALSLDLRQVYAFSVALMDLDSADESLRSQGLEELKALCANESSSVYDAALFYLGEYYWKQQNYQEARLWWAQLILVANKKMHGAPVEAKSPWVALAKERVALLDC